MTAQDRTTLKSEFETGDVPDGTDYANLIDSFLSLTDTSAQSVVSPVTFSGSAAFTGTVTAATAKVLGGMNVSGAVTAGSVDVLGTLTVSGAVSAAGNVNIVGVVTAASANIGGGAIVSGAMTAGSLGVLGALRVSAATSLEGATVLGGALTVVTAQTTATASGAVGGSTVPATATKYLKVVVSGVTYNVALYPSV